MIMSLKQREIKIKPSIKLNHNIYNTPINYNELLQVIDQWCN